MTRAVGRLVNRPFFISIKDEVMKTKVYAVSGTVEIPSNLDINDFIAELGEACKGKYKDVDLDLDQLDDITNEDDDE